MYTERVFNMNDIHALYDLWCEKAVLDADLIEELKSVKGDEEAILDRFYKDLEFGTGGLRGVIGAGTNRMNIYTVRKATQGLANYILKQNKCQHIYLFRFARMILILFCFFVHFNVYY